MPGIREYDQTMPVSLVSVHTITFQLEVSQLIELFITFIGSYNPATTASALM
jgi:hypothetical protein